MKTKQQSARLAILHIAPTPFFSDRGCHIRIEGVVRCLKRLDFRNIVCTYHTGRDVSDIVTHRIGSIHGYTKTAAGPSPYKFWADLKLLLLCIQQYRQMKPDAIHAHLHEGVLIGLLLKLVFFWRRTPIIADMQGSLTGELESHGVFKKYAFLKWPVMAIERLLLLLANKIVCSSQHSVELFKSRFPESTGKITLAQDGADDPPPTDLEQLNALRLELGIDPEATCVVYSGALLESKGLNELQELILYSRDLEPPIHFLIIGYPTTELEMFILENNLQPLCTLTGQLGFDSLADHLALGNIAIDPKNSDAGEGSGKILNYMANAMAIVAFDTTNNRKFLGSQIKLARSIDEACELLLFYVNDKSAASNTGQDLHARFKENYSWKVCQLQLQKTYTSLFSQ